jgi:hypothetical protein
MRPAHAHTLALLGALLLILAAGCDQKVQPPKPRMGAAEKSFQDAQAYEADNLDKAIRHYKSVITQTDALIRDLVPGDPLLPEAQKLRARAVEAIASASEKRRQKEIEAAAPAPKPQDDRFPTKNLTPPVLAYVPPAVKPPEDPKKEPGDPKKEPADPKKEPKDETKKEPKDEPKKEPPKPKTVRVTKVELKKDGKTVLIYWTFTNLESKNVRIGAPMGELLNKTGSRLTSFRQHFLAKNFEFNAADPLASRGTAVTPDSVQLGPGGARALVTVGITTANVGKQAGGGKVVVRMSDGAEPTDSLQDISRE